MSDPTGRDPLDDLRRANPIDADRLPSASLASIWARIQEDTMNGSTQARPHRRWVLPSAIAGVALGAAALVAVFGGSGGVLPAGGPDGSGSANAASCVEQYSLDAVARRAFAFDGVVTSVSGDEVTFSVNQTYRGPAAGSVTLTATGMTGSTVTSAGGPSLSIGQRYLVAGEDRFVWGCGFTQPYDAAVAAQWARAFAP